ncbi:MAG: hypothetical protein RMY64_12425 [Nostoc sp. DedQUE08]|uniref:hypothetical protein n=1 Tax=unclassified Nostoc TaxID=2593658 RepID=UPI002AD59F82|nr:MULTISPECIES: hypothetical protein [unclassified Nostoc]MDZ8032311.1 hypothetical protein [Nostoc sp. DedSLP04]MDZ8066428.1 hypothetical protein [Nostoc sp. DedQUE08]
MTVLLFAILLAINLGAGCYLTLANPLKVSEQTSTKLIFIIRPKVFLGLGIFFSQLFVLFLFASIVFTPITQLVCNRYPNNISTSNIDLSAGQNTLTVMCKLTKNNWLGREQSQTLVSELLEAKLETQIDTDGQAKYYKYNILLLNDRDSFPFSRAGYPKFNLEKLQLIVSRINNFLKNPIENNLAVILDETFTGYISVMITVFCGILALLVASLGLFITCNFDKETNTVKLSRYRWFGTLGKTVFQYSLNEITGIKLERIDTSIGEYFFRVILILELGDNLLLTPNYTSNYINGDFIVKVTKDFLELKHKDSAR